MKSWLNRILKGYVCIGMTFAMIVALSLFPSNHKLLVQAQELPPDIGYTIGGLDFDGATQRYFRDVIAYNTVTGLISLSARMWVVDFGAGELATDLSFISATFNFSFDATGELCNGQNPSPQCIQCVIGVINNECNTQHNSKANAAASDALTLMLACALAGLAGGPVAAAIAIACIILAAKGFSDKMDAADLEWKQCVCNAPATCSGRLGIQCAPFPWSSLIGVKCAL